MVVLEILVSLSYRVARMLVVISRGHLIPLSLYSIT